MTSKYGTNSILLTQLPNSISTGTNKLTPLMGFYRSGIPVEGQLPKSAQNLSGTITAGNFTAVSAGGANNCFYELQEIAAATQITFNATDLNNMIGHHYVFTCPTFGSGTTKLVLPSTAVWNDSATAHHTATFDTAAPSSIEFWVMWDSVASAPLIVLGTNLNITFS